MKNLYLDYKTILYNFIFFVLWGVLFFTNYTLDILFEYLDIITYLELNKLEFYQAILCTVIFIFFVKYFIRTFLSIKYHYQVNKTIEFFTEGFVYAFEGVQNTGKSFCTIFYAYMVARYKWGELCKAHLYYMNMKEKLKRKAKISYLDNITLNIYESKEKAYQYFNKNIDKYIPCLISNNRVYEKKTKRRSYPFQIELLNMLKRVPESCVFILDEVAEDLPNTMRLTDESKTKNKSQEQIEAERQVRAVNTFLSMARQFADAVLFVNDQRIMESFNGLRAVSQATRSLKEKKEVLKPHILEKVLNRIYKTIKKESGEEKKFKKVAFYEKMYKTMGYLKITYVEKYGFDDVFKNEKNELNMLLPQNMPFIYHHRAKSIEYQAKNKKLELILKDN